MTSPVATSRAANSEVVPLRLSSWVRRSGIWPGSIGRTGLSAVEGLDLALFVDAQHQRAIRRIDM